MADRDYWDSISRLQREHGLSESDTDEAIRKTTEVRFKKYWKRLEGKYPAGLISRGMQWGQENLSKAELLELNPEKILIVYMSNCPDECTSGEMGLVLGKDGQVKPLLRSYYSDPIEEGRWEQDAEGNLSEKPKPKPERQPIEMPSEKQLKEMPLEDLGKLVARAKEYLNE